MPAQFKQILLLATIILIVCVLYKLYQWLAYRVYSVHQQSGKPGVWTDGWTRKTIDQPTSYHIAYRKRFGWLPGRKTISQDITKKQYESARKSAVTYSEWDTEFTFGKVYYLVSNPTSVEGKLVKVKTFTRDEME